MKISEYLMTRQKPSRRWVTIAVFAGTAVSTYIDKRIYEKRFRRVEADLSALRVVNRVHLGPEADDLFASTRNAKPVEIDLEQLFMENVAPFFKPKGGRDA